VQFEDSHAAANRLALHSSSDPFESALQAIRKRLAQAFKAEQLAQAGPVVSAEARRLAAEQYHRTNQEALKQGLERLQMAPDLFIDQALAELLGMGALDALLRDPDIEDIAINGPSEVLVYRQGTWASTGVSFPSASRCAAGNASAWSPIRSPHPTRLQ